MDGIRTVVERSPHAAGDDRPTRAGGLALPGHRDTERRSDPGADDPPLVVRENGLAFEVDVVRGHKTGFYLDQRDNRARVRSLAAGRRVLNLFAYTGGFAVAAAAGGATESLSLDIAAPAIDAARRNLARNDADPTRHRAEIADVRRALRGPSLARTRWDLIVLDPPSFAPSRKALPKALVAYRRLNAAALRLARPGTLLVSCSCSSHVDRRTFLRVLRDAAADAGVPLGRPAVHGAPPDHPSLAGFPEGDYLKAAFVTVEGASRS
jgi:23S rRNA (cytosine1962-C5)-methyltransferase